jgi:hypothetical protein
MSQHTPGPWIIEQRVNSMQTIIRYVGANPASLDGRDIASVAEYPAQADARLIASAPELLAALTESLRWIAKVAADHDDDPVLHGQALRAHDKARAAIRKAEEG